MKINIEDNLKELAELISRIEGAITHQVKMGYTDANKTMERLLTPLINSAYKKQFIWLEEQQRNHPGIDLSDEFSRIGVQISSDGSSKKFRETMEILKKNELNDKYDEIWFFIISNQQISTVTDDEVETKKYNLQSLSQEFLKADEVAVERAIEYIKRNFEFSSTDYSILPSALKGVIPESDFNEFIKIQGWGDTDEEILLYPQVRKGLYELNNVLTTLSKNQREFICFIMMKSEIEKIETWQKKIITNIYPRVNTKTAQTHFGNKIPHDLFQSLEHTKLCVIVEEEDGQYNYMNYFYYLTFEVEEVLDFNYFEAIIRFLNEKNQMMKIKEVIVDCNFSTLG